MLITYQQILFWDWKLPPPKKNMIQKKILTARPMVCISFLFPPCLASFLNHVFLTYCFNICFFFLYFKCFTYWTSQNVWLFRIRVSLPVLQKCHPIPFSNVGRNGIGRVSCLKYYCPDQRRNAPVTNESSDRARH